MHVFLYVYMRSFICKQRDTQIVKSDFKSSEVIPSVALNSDHDRNRNRTWDMAPICLAMPSTSSLSIVRNAFFSSAVSFFFFSLSSSVTSTGTPSYDYDTVDGDGGVRMKVDEGSVWRRRGQNEGGRGVGMATEGSE